MVDSLAVGFPGAVVGAASARVAPHCGPGSLGRHSSRARIRPVAASLGPPPVGRGRCSGVRSESTKWSAKEGYPTTDSNATPDNAVSEGRLMLKRYLRAIRESQHDRCADCGKPLGDGSQTMRENKGEPTARSAGLAPRRLPLTRSSRLAVAPGGPTR